MDHSVWFSNPLLFKIFASSSVGVGEGKQHVLRQIRSVGNVGGKRLEVGGWRKLEVGGKRWGAGREVEVQAEWVDNSAPRTQDSALWREVGSEKKDQG